MLFQNPADTRDQKGIDESADYGARFDTFEMPKAEKQKLSRMPTIQLE